MTVSKDIWNDLISSKKEVKQREQVLRLVDKVSLKVESMTPGTELIMVSFYVSKDGVPVQLAKKSLESNYFFQAVIKKQMKTGKHLKLPLSRVPKSSYDPLECEEFIPTVLWNPIRKFFGMDFCPRVLLSFFESDQERRREAELDDRIKEDTGVMGPRGIHKK